MTKTVSSLYVFTTHHHHLCPPLGSTIKIDYKDAHHAMEVVAVQNGEEQLDGGNIQDVNVAVDFTGVKKKKGKGKKKD